MLRTVISIAAVVISALAAGYVHLIFVNTSHNSALEIEEGYNGDILLCDQKGKTGKRYRYGLYTLSHNGCEVMAYHNARLLTGRPRALWEDIRHFQSACAMFGYGFFGSLPRSIGRVLKKDHIPYHKVKVEHLTVPGIYIISFWNSKRFLFGLHTVAAESDGHLLTLYNFMGVKTVHADTAFDGDFISAYYLGKRSHVLHKIRK